MTTDRVEGIILLIVLGLSLATFYGPWQWFCIDRARQQLFEIRARLFNLAASGRISFEAPQYRAMRENLNQRLRFAHRVCWQQVFALAWVHRNLPSESEFTRLIREIEDHELREILEAEATKARQAMMRLVMFRSPVLLIWFVCTLIVDAIIRCVRPRKTPYRFLQPNLGERVSVEAESIGPLLDHRQMEALDHRQMEAA